MRANLFALAAITLGGFVPGHASPAPKPGTLEVRFLYLPPGSVDPTYHTAIWLEDEDGKLVKTLYVSNELSGTEYKLGTVCPDWVKQAGWAKAPKSLVDAVTGPTPNVGSSSMTFDLASAGIAPGIYRFRMQVHIVDQYNILFQGKLTAGSSGEDVKIETLYQPSKPDIGTDVVRDVRVHYAPAAGN
jgi:hypothetical protein